jgi:hypothetical protein
VANDNKIEIRIAPLVDAREGSTIRSRAASEIASQRPRPIHHSPLQSTGCSLAIPDFLIANPELELLASNTKSGPLRFSNRKKIAVFDPRRSAPFGESKAPSSPVTRLSLALTTAVAAEGSLITAFLIATFANSEFKSTHCKHALYKISNRYQNACFEFSASRTLKHGSWGTNHESRITSHESRTTTHAAFRSTIPRGQNADH